MPIYEFTCISCQAVNDDLVSVGTQTIECPVCHSTMYKSKGSYLTVSTGLPNGFASIKNQGAT